MSNQRSGLSARQERVQPSLWDRLVDELPGVLAETDSMRLELSKELGRNVDLEQVVLGGARAVEQLVDLGDEQRQKLHVYVAKMHQRQRLEDSGIVVDADTLREAVRRDIEMLFNIERMLLRFFYYTFGNILATKPKKIYLLTIKHTPGVILKISFLFGGCVW